MENDSGLLLTLAILNVSVQMVEKTIQDSILFNLSGIMVIEKRNQCLL